MHPFANCLALKVALLFVLFLPGSQSERVTNRGSISSAATVNEHTQQRANTTTGQTCCCSVEAQPWKCELSHSCIEDQKQKTAPNVDWNQVVCLQKDMAYLKAPFNYMAPNSWQDWHLLGSDFFRVAYDTNKLVKIGAINIWDIGMGDALGETGGITLEQLSDQWRLTIAGTEPCGSGGDKRENCATVKFSLEKLKFLGFGFDWFELPQLGFQLKFYLDTFSKAEDLMFGWLDEVEDHKKHGSLLLELESTDEQLTVLRMGLLEAVRLVFDIDDVLDYIKSEVAKAVLKALQTIFVKLADSPLSSGAGINKFELRVHDVGDDAGEALPGDILKLNWVITARFAVPETAAFEMLKHTACEDGKDSATCNAKAFLKEHNFTDFFRVPMDFSADVGIVEGKTDFNFNFKAKADLRKVLQANSKVCKDMQICGSLVTQGTDTVILLEGKKEESLIAVELGMPSVKLQNWSMGLSALSQSAERSAITVGLTLPAEGEANAEVEFPSWKCAHVGPRQATFLSCKLLGDFLGNSLKMKVSVKNFAAAIEAQADGTVGVHLCDTACGDSASAPEIRASVETPNIRLALVGGPAHALLEIDVRKAAMRTFIDELKKTMFFSQTGSGALKVPQLSMSFTDVQVIDFAGEMSFNNDDNRMDLYARYQIAITGLTCDPACGMLGAFLDMQDELMVSASLEVPVAAYNELEAEGVMSNNEDRYNIISCDLGWNEEVACQKKCRNFAFHLMSRKDRSREVVYANIVNTRRGTLGTVGFTLDFHQVWPDIMVEINNYLAGQDYPVKSVMFDKVELGTSPTFEFGCLLKRPYVKLGQMKVNSKWTGFGATAHNIHSLKTLLVKAGMFLGNKVVTPHVLLSLMNINFFAFLEDEGHRDGKKYLHVCWPQNTVRTHMCRMLYGQCASAVDSDCDDEWLEEKKRKSQQGIALSGAQHIQFKNECKKNQTAARRCSDFHSHQCEHSPDCETVAGRPDTWATDVELKVFGGEIIRQTISLLAPTIRHKLTYKLLYYLSKMVGPLMKKQGSCKSSDDVALASGTMHVKVNENFEIQVSSSNFMLSNLEVQNDAIVKLLQAPIRAHLKDFLPVVQALQDGGESKVWTRVPLPKILKVRLVHVHLQEPARAWDGDSELHEDFELQEEWLVNTQPVWLWRCRRQQQYWTIYFLQPHNDVKAEGWWTMARTARNIIPEIGEPYADYLRRPGASPSQELRSPKKLLWWGVDQSLPNVMWQVSLTGEGSIFASDAELHLSMEAKHPLILGTIGKGKAAIQAAAEFSLLGLGQSVPQAHLPTLAAVVRDKHVKTNVQSDLSVTFADGLIDVKSGFKGTNLHIGGAFKQGDEAEKVQGLQLTTSLREKLTQDAVNGLGPLPMQFNAPTDRPPFPSVLDSVNSDVHARVSFDGSILNLEKLHGMTHIAIPKIGLLMDEVSPVAHNFAFGMGLVEVSKPKIRDGQLVLDSGYRMVMDEDFDKGTYIVGMNCGFLRIWPCAHLCEITDEKPWKIFDVETAEFVDDTSSETSSCSVFKVKEVNNLPTKTEEAEVQDTESLYQFCSPRDTTQDADMQLYAWMYLIGMEADRLKAAHSNGQCKASNPKPLSPELVPSFPGTTQWIMKDIGILKDDIKDYKRCFWRKVTPMYGEEDPVVK